MNRDLTIYIDGREIYFTDGQTILEAAAAGGVNIPTLCHDERVAEYGACGLCVVEAENSPRLLRACSTPARDGMKIKTASEKVVRARRSALELLLSDHAGDCVAPCKRACPAETDCQGYVGLIANGEYGEAAALIREKLPLPASIGRVCPRPCEEKCRRALIDEPVGIAGLKTFAAENAGEYMPEIKADTGRRVAIVGGGPGGLSAAYFLRVMGHGVTVYDAMPAMGGMLRYGVPEYRLPKAVLDREIGAIEGTGVKFINNARIGGEIKLSELRGGSDAVIVAIGAWRGASLDCPGEHLTNVVNGVDFLRDISWRDDSARDRSIYKSMIENKRVAVIGGGDTAMDACRTAVRLGAASVHDIYRRSRAEIPANDAEISEAEEEGVIFKYLHSPIEIAGQDSVTHIRLQRMALAEPDASGRRAPVAIPGDEELLPVDAVIVMIGQTVAADGFEELKFTKKNTISANESTFETNLPGVFAIGDATNVGAGIAIEAIGEAGRCARAVHGYLSEGRALPSETEIIITEVKTAEDYSTRKKEARIKAGVLSVNARRNNFSEIKTVFTSEQAKTEAARCLECGCSGYFDCLLYRYSNEYGAAPDRYAGEVRSCVPDVSSPYMYLNMNKCILCGLCVRICAETAGVAALGLMNRGFGTAVRPELDRPLAETSCTFCGQCAYVCPTAAIGELAPLTKRVPLRTRETDAVCDGCGLGCAMKILTRGRLRLKNIPAEGGALCGEGRFGFIRDLKKKRVTMPMIREDGVLRETSFEGAAAYVIEKLASVAARYGRDSVGVSVSEKYSNEEIAAIKKFATDRLNTKNIFAFGGGNEVPEGGLLNDGAPKIPFSRGAVPVRIETGVNSRGLSDTGITYYSDKSNVIKALVVFGGDSDTNVIKSYLPDVEFLTVVGAYETETTRDADCVLPAAVFYEKEGSYTNADGITRKSHAALEPPFIIRNLYDLA